MYIGFSQCFDLIKRIKKLPESSLAYEVVVDLTKSSREYLRSVVGFHLHSSSIEVLFYHTVS